MKQIKSLASSLRLFVNTKEDWDKLSQQLQQKSDQPAEKKHSVYLYIKAFAVGAICITILLFPLLYFSFHKPDKNLVLKTQEKIKWKEVKADKNTTLVLHDSSEVILSPGSTLFYPETFSGNERSVRSTGEVFFRIRHDDKRPFIITTPMAVIKDLGTAFLLRSTDSIQEVIVTEGKVKMTSRTDTAQSVIMVQGESGSIIGNLVAKRATAAPNDMASYTHELSFRNTPLTTVAEDLSRYYDMPVSIAASLQKKNLVFTGHFRNKSLKEVLRKIASDLHVDVEKSAASYRLVRLNLVQKFIKQLN